MLYSTTIDQLLTIKDGLEDPETARVLDLVVSQLENIRAFLRTANPNSSDITDGMCLEVSRFFNGILKENGFQPVVLEGEVELAKDDWLEHHLSLIHLPRHWVTVDFGVSQITRYKDAPFLVLICEPEKSALRDALKTVYDWWTPD